MKETGDFQPKPAVKKLTVRKLKALSFLLQGESIKDAARKTKISESSLYEWLKDPQFQERLQESRENLFHEGLAQLKSAMVKASCVLIKLLSSEDEGQRRLAARAIFDYGLRGFDLQEIEDRLTKIESILAEQKPFIS